MFDRTRQLTVVLGAALLSAACVHQLKYASLDPPGVPAKPADYKWQVAGVTYGEVSISGTVKGGAFTPAAQHGVANQPLSTSDSREGNEFDQSCGEQKRKSSAQSSATFTPQLIEAQRRYGFALSTKAYGRGGFWRSWVGIDTWIGHIGACQGSHDESGSAVASSVGRIELTFAGSDVSLADRLVVQVTGSGAQQADIQVADQNGNALKLVPESNVGARIYDVPKPGIYVVRAALRSEASAGGACCDKLDERSISVAAFSLRDALALVGQPMGAGFSTTLPVFVAKEDIEKVARNELFDPDGKFYPCRAKTEAGKPSSPDPDCSDYAHDVYLENIQTQVRGGGVEVAGHLSGHARWWFFRPGVTGDVSVMTTPELASGALVLRNTRLNVDTRNELVHVVSNIYADKLLKRIGEVSVPVQTRVNEELRKVQKNFPMKWGSSCLLLTPESVSIQSIRPSEAPQGIEVSVKVDLKTVDAAKCEQPAVRI